MPLVVTSTPRPNVRLLILNRPEKRNALSVALLEEMVALLQAAASDDEVRCVVITGDRTAFSAGADIADQQGRGLDSALGSDRLAAWSAIEAFAKPKIAAVNGYALGGGHELVLLCDFAIAGEGAQFGSPEINLGIFPGDGGTLRLPRIIGRPNALRAILTGERIGAARALAMGLVTEVVPDAETVERALDVAADIAGKSPIAVRLARESIIKGLGMPLDEGLLLERRNIALAFGSEDQKEGMAAFLEKRKPTFRGR